MGEFHKCILNKVRDSFHGENYDNFDFGIRDFSKRMRVNLYAERIINFGLSLAKKNVKAYLHRPNFYWENISAFEPLFDQLEDEKSKSALIDSLCFKMMGFSKVRLPLNNTDFWQMRDRTKDYLQDSHIEANFRGGRLELYDLSKLGYDVKLYINSNGVVTEFMLQQYNFDDLVRVEKGDIVLDVGGCWGDTALYFAAMGASEVYTYEFIPSNIDILMRNIALNPRYQDKIKLIDHPVWDTSEVVLSYRDTGPSSRVGEKGVFKQEVVTISIDDTVRERGLQTVDFIKMDIEGAEIQALNGAADTIRKFKPKLALSVYHKRDDMIEIPKLVKSLRSDYKFYLDYYTIIGDEIILYAI